MSKHIGHLTTGDVIQCIDPDDVVITVTITSISINPTFGTRGGVLIGIHHEPSNTDNFINLDNLVQWFKEAEWKKATA